MREGRSSSFMTRSASRSPCAEPMRTMRPVRSSATAMSPAIFDEASLPIAFICASSSFAFA